MPVQGVTLNLDLELLGAFLHKFSKVRNTSIGPFYEVAHVFGRIDRGAGQRFACLCVVFSYQMYNTVAAVYSGSRNLTSDKVGNGSSCKVLAGLLDNVKAVLSYHGHETAELRRAFKG